MASSSSSMPRTLGNKLFASFHGPDVNKTAVIQLRKKFNRIGISMFDDQGIEKSQTIAPALKQAIRESRVSIVVLSKNYASSSGCLDELVEILNCWKERRQIVIPVFFYGVDPSHVRNQTGYFGSAFNETCARKPEEKRLLWKRALTTVANISGGVFENRADESGREAMIFNEVAKRLSSNWSDPASSDIRTTANQNVWSDPGSMDIITTANQNVWSDPGSSDIITTANQNVWSDPGSRDIITTANQNVWSDPGSSDIITTANQNVLQGIRNRSVNFLSIEGALPITGPSISTNSRYSIGRVFLVVIINLLLEIAAAVADQLSSIRKPHFARISLVMSILSLVLTILDFISKIRDHKVYFRCKWPIPWFYYPSRVRSRIFGSSTDAVFLICVVGQFIVSTINYSFTERGRNGPIKVSVWPLVFSVGMVVSKIMEKPHQFEEIV